MAKRKMKWAEESRKLEEQQVKDSRPPGFQTIEEIAEEMGCHEDTAVKKVKALMKAGRAEQQKGKRIGGNGTIQQCNYFRLIGEKAGA